MKWPWRRPDESGIDAAQERLDAAHAAQPEVSRVVRKLRDLRDENNYGARLAAVFKDHR